MDLNLTVENETSIEEGHSHFENFLLVLKISITLTTVLLNSLLRSTYSFKKSFMKWVKKIFS